MTKLLIISLVVLFGVSAGSGPEQYDLQMVKLMGQYEGARSFTLEFTVSVYIDIYNDRQLFSTEKGSVVKYEGTVRSIYKDLEYFHNDALSVNVDHRLRTISYALADGNMDEAMAEFIPSIDEVSPSSICDTSYVVEEVPYNKLVCVGHSSGIALATTYYHNVSGALHKITYTYGMDDEGVANEVVILYKKAQVGVPTGPTDLKLSDYLLFNGDVVILNPRFENYRLLTTKK